MIYCGVDGGQTSTKCVLATAQGELLGVGTGGPLVHLSAKGGKEQFAASISEAIANAWGAQKPSTIDSLVVGATGVFEDTIESATAIELLSPLFAHSVINVCSDALIALVGAHAGASGIMVISGTGTIAYGIQQDGSESIKLERAGGWGWPLGDAGSAFSIGRAGLQAALHASDGLGPETVLLPLMLEHFGVTEPHDVKRFYFEPTFGAAAFAALATLVSRAVDQGDLVAQKIVSTAGKALANQARAVAKKIEFSERDSVNIAPVGGAFKHISGLEAAMSSALEATAEPGLVDLVVSPPRLKPQAGAYLMALQQANQPITDELITAIEAWDI